MEAGQVWTPNSAYKTAQAIMDIDREGLPLVILANMRGFSGGQQDMYDEILKQGSKIVDGLSSFKQPVFVYIVPNGELRGGAWVVLDPTINDAQMEMYADVDARGGILEPEGIVEIKFRKDKITSVMNRLDPQYAALKAASNDASKSAEERTKSGEELKKREAHLHPTYMQIAHLYADLHDRVGRMQAKGCAQEMRWIEARRRLYWRLRRRLNEEHLHKMIQKANPSLSLTERRDLILNLVKSEDGEDRSVAEWVEGATAEIGEEVQRIRTRFVSGEIVKFAEGDRRGALEGLTAVLQTLSEEDRKTLIASLAA